MITDALSEYRADWVLSGKAPSTVDKQLAMSRRFAVETSTQTVEEARRWGVAAPTRSMQHERTQSFRSFWQWSHWIGENQLLWWEQIRLPAERERAQPTANAQGFLEGPRRLLRACDRAILGTTALGDRCLSSTVSAKAAFLCDGVSFEPVDERSRRTRTS